MQDLQQTVTQVAENVTAAVNTKALLRELEWVARFVDSKTTIPILGNVMIRVSAGRMELTATDLEVGAIAELESGGEFQITVPAKQTLKYLKRVSESEVSLSLDGAALTIRHGEDSEAIIPGMGVDSYPELPTMPADSFRLSGLATAIPRALTSISTEASRFTLNGALLALESDGQWLISTDGHRLSLADVMATNPAPMRALIPLSALFELGHMKADSCDFTVNEHHAFFQIGSRRVICRKLTGNFPDWRRVLPTCEHSATVDGKGLTKAIERVSLFADERSGATTYTFSPNRLTVSASVTEAGKAKGSVPATWDGAEWATQLDWRYVMAFLKLIPPAIAFDFQFAEHEVSEITGNVKPRPVEFRIPGWRYVVCPMRA